MSRVNEVENRIKELEGGKFQKLCNSYLYQKYGLENISPLGSQEGTDKTTIGVPDTFIEHDDGTYTLIMYGTHKDVKKKIREDILDCLNESKTGISKSKIKKIICCHTSTNINIREIENIKEQTQGVSIKLIGLGTLSQDISSPKFQGIAKEYLNIGFGTEQIFDINGFVKAYDKNVTVSPLDIDFKFREDKVSEIKEAVSKNTAVLISGASGVGKTRISLEICKYFESEGYQVLCVKNNGQPLYDDFKISVSTLGKYLLFIDDMNQISDIVSVVDWILLNDRDDVEIKILATVRDYAKGRIVDLLSKFNLFSVIKVPIFKNEDIKKILDECLGIKNEYFQDRIAKIAKGNIRLAILAGKFAIEDVEKIKNSSEIFKHYYGKIIDEGKLSHETIKILFIVSLLNTVKIKDDDFAKILLAEFNITWESFKTISHELHQNELVDLYLDEIVKIGDQSFGNYILEYVLVEQKFISIERLLELGFSIKKGRIIYAINTILELFHSKEIEKYISDQINNQWNKAKMEEQDAYLETFYLVNLDKSLDILNRRISDMEPTTFEITDDFFKEKQKNQNITSLELNILSGFKNTKYFEEAIELIVVLFKKRPDLFMDIYFVFTKKFSYDKNSFKLSYERENVLINTLCKLRTNTNFNYDFLLLKVIGELLKTSISTSEQGEDANSVTFINFTVSLNDGCKILRRNLWEILSVLSEDETLIVRVQEILRESSRWTGEMKRVIPVFEFDLSCIKDLFADKWITPDFDQCLVLSKITDFAKSMDIKIDSDFRKYEENEDYQYYKIIKPKEDRRYSEDFEKQNEGEIKELTSTFLIDDYRRLFLIAKHVENDTGFLNYHLGLNLVTVLKCSSEQMCEDMLKCYFQCDAPYSIRCTVVMFDFLNRFGFEKTYTVINEINYQYRNVWISSLFEVVPEDRVKEEQVNLLFNFIESQRGEVFPSIPRLNTILKYTKFDEELLVKFCKIVHGLSKNRSSIAYDFLIEYHQSVDKLIEIFSNNLDVLEELYMDAKEENLDYDGKMLIEIVKVDSIFWDRYTQDIANNDLFSQHEKKEIFQEIWKLENYQTLIDVAFYNILQNSRKYIGWESYELIFPVDRKNLEVNERIKKWILNYIRENSSDHELIRKLFFHFVSNQNETDRLDYISEFLKQNRTIKDFETLSLVPSFYEWSGSEVPLIDKNISFISLLLKSSFLKGLDFISHRSSLKNYIIKLEKEKKRIQMKEYQDDYIS